MKTEEGRRSFVRSMMIGVPAFAGSALVLPAAHAAPVISPFAAGDAGAESRIDDVLRRMAALHNEVAARMPTKADARRAVDDLRALIGYRREAGRDVMVTEAFRQMIDVRGRDALATMEPDLSRMRAGLVYYGIDAAALTIGTPTKESRLVALDTLARRGVEPFYDDVLGSVSWEVMLAEPPGLCAMMREMMNMFEAVAATMCLGALLFPPMAAECFAATVVLTALKLMSLFMMC